MVTRITALITLLVCFSVGSACNGAELPVGGMSFKNYDLIARLDNLIQQTRIPDFHSYLRFQRVRFHCKNRQVEKTADDLTFLKLKFGKSGYRFAAEASVIAMQQSATAAIAYLEKQESRADSDRAFLLGFLSELFMNAGMYNKAESSAQQAIESDNFTAAAHRTLAALCAMKQDYKAEYEHLRMEYTIEPRPPFEFKPNDLIKRIVVVCGKLGLKRQQAHFLVKLANKTKQIQHAINAWDEFITFPPDLRCATLASQLLFEAWPHDPRALRRVRDSLIWQERYDLAYFIQHRIVELDPSEHTSSRLRAIGQRQTKPADNVTASDVLSFLGSARSQQTRYTLLRAELEMHNSSPAELDKTKKLLEVQFFLIKIGRLNEAEEIHNEIYSRDPSSASTLISSARMAHQRDEWFKADQLMQAAVSRNPNAIETLKAKCEWALINRDYDSLEVLSAKLTSHLPYSRTAHDYLAWCHVYKEDFTGVIPHAGTSLFVAPLSFSSVGLPPQRSLGIAWFRTGRLDHLASYLDESIMNPPQSVNGFQEKLAFTASIGDQFVLSKLKYIHDHSELDAESTFDLYWMVARGFFLMENYESVIDIVESKRLSTPSGVEDSMLAVAYAALNRPIECSYYLNNAYMRVEAKPEEHSDFLNPATTYITARRQMLPDLNSYVLKLRVVDGSYFLTSDARESLHAFLNGEYKKAKDVLLPHRPRPPLGSDDRYWLSQVASKQTPEQFFLRQCNVYVSRFLRLENPHLR